MRATIQLVGNLGSEIKPLGSKGLKFSVVCNNGKDKNTGEEKADWYNVAVYNENLKGFLQDYFNDENGNAKKGFGIAINGTLEQNKINDEKTFYNVIADKIQFPPFNGSKKETGTQPQTAQPVQQPAQQAAPQQSEADNFGSEDIPF